MPTTAGMAVQQLLYGAIIGGVVTYLLGRLLEPYKARVASAAKRHDRFYEEQAKALAQTFERAAVALDALFELCWLGVTKKEDVAAVEAQFEEFQKANAGLDSYFESRRIYFAHPDQAERVRTFSAYMAAAAGELRTAIDEGQDAHDLFKIHLAALKQLDSIGEDFRRTMLGPEPRPWYRQAWLSGAEPGAAASRDG